MLRSNHHQYPYQYQSLCGRAYASFGQQRKLFLLVFLWTCFCLFLFRSTLLSSSNKISPDEHEELARVLPQSDAWVASSSAPSPAIPEPVPVPPSPASLSEPTPSQQFRVLSNSQKQQEQQVTNNHQHKAALEDEINQHGCVYNYPSLFDLQFNNIHWQKMSFPGKTHLDHPNATYYMYSAYYDDRWRAGKPSVRILAMIDRIEPPPTHCLLWSSNRAEEASGADISPLSSSSSAQSFSSSNPSPLSSSATSNAAPRAERASDASKMRPIVTKATFVYAWYPKWGNYMDGILQPWIVTCPIPSSYNGLVPESVSLVPAPPEIQLSSQPGTSLDDDNGDDDPLRSKRQAQSSSESSPNLGASMAMPPSFSSSMSPQLAAGSAAAAAMPATSSSTNIQVNYATSNDSASLTGMPEVTKISSYVKYKSRHTYDCRHISPISNNLPVYNRRPQVKGKFAVCVKGLDFPDEDISVRLVEWIELLNLLGAGKIFLYDLDVHENISKVLNYYQQRGMIELSPLTLPGDQPNLPEYQHLYLKSKLTAKRQNELIPYNDCLYRNLYSFQYLALLDIDEIIMPLKHHNWFDLMQEVETRSLAEQNYSRASYNVRNVYFFDDLAGPLGTTSSSTPARSYPLNSQDDEGGNLTDLRENSPGEQSLEHGIPHYLHMMQHVYRSRNYTKPGQYVKCFHNTDRVVSLHNHFPMNCFGQCTTYSIPLELAHLQHYRKDCVGPLKQSCKNDFRAFTTRDTTIWKYKQQMIRRTTRVLNHLGFLKKKKAARTIDRK